MIARLNRFFRRMMRTHHILGAKQFYDTISMASPSSFSGQRLVNRCHVLYKHFKVADFIAPTAPSLNQEAKLGEATVGIMSVGHIVHVLGDPGVVVVREFGDTSMAVDKNPPVLFDLLKREIATCQTCSNRGFDIFPEEVIVTSRCYSPATARSVLRKRMHEKQVLCIWCSPRARACPITRKRT